ncbi:hypothetical protein Pcinc_041771 [Petrolisthes cinctipes]|uniref:asparagine--tRNA ligase n=1 Tax=Petrolisthes cinctipes TaxID=88211 RepID=A0AAE1BIY8_PETCI|nr:hypothetical protein Pcinc_041771 [Petrolisthes cinctipes]
MAVHMVGLRGLMATRQYCNNINNIPRQVRRVVALLQDQPLHQTVTVKGWVKGMRRQKERTFLDIDDGSCYKKLQVVLNSDQRPATLGYHSAVSATGILQPSTHPSQEVELLAEEIEVVDVGMQGDYPFKARQTHPPDYTRRFPHLRPRTNSFASLLRVRSQMKAAIQHYFEREGFINVDTPILTTNDCEGGGEVFMVQHLMAEQQSKGSSEGKVQDSYFKQPAYLTVSGQLHLEAVANGLSKVYNFSPAFRSENSQTRRHLAEFWMVEAEEAFLVGREGMEALLGRLEGLVKEVMTEVLEVTSQDVQAHWQRNQGTEEAVRSALDKPFSRVSYAEALDILSGAPDLPPVSPGQDLAREHELYLTNTLGHTPVLLTDWPLTIKPFYMSACEDDSSLALAVDLLVPGVGEVAGGGLREHHLPTLQGRLPPPQHHHNNNSLQWYLDLRALGGGVPTGGFGIGVERLLQFLLGIHNIKDTLPFPRWAHHCPC